MQRMGSNKPPRLQDTTSITDQRTKKQTQKDTSSFISPAQDLALSQHDDAQSQTADEDALSAAIAASMQDVHATNKRMEAHKKFLTPAQIHALEHGDVASQQDADEEALAIGLQASFDTMEKPKADAVAKKRGISEEHFTGQRLASAKLRTWFTDRGYQIIPNHAENNNCLLTSLIQHATGDYQSEHKDKAEKYKALLIQSTKETIQPQDSLYEDTPAMARIIAMINKDHGCQHQVDFYTADLRDDPLVMSVGKSDKRVIIFNQVGHFEAVLPPSKKR